VQHHRRVPRHRQASQPRRVQGLHAQQLLENRLTRTLSKPYHTHAACVVPTEAHPAGPSISVLSTSTDPPAGD
jgi:hypothetical protein